MKPFLKTLTALAVLSMMSACTVTGGPQGPKGDQGEQGEQGAAGFSPTITVIENTAEVYKLRITTADGSFDTPNLRGGGAGGVDVGVDGDNLIFTYN